jgi:hypothetical protein
MISWTGRLLLLLLVVLFAHNASAHRFAPSLLKVIETGSGQYNMVWKTPAQGTSNIPLRPTWPDECVVSNATPAQLEGTGKVSSWQSNAGSCGAGCQPGFGHGNDHFARRP